MSDEHGDHVMIFNGRTSFNEEIDCAEGDHEWIEDHEEQQDMKHQQMRRKPI